MLSELNEIPLPRYYAPAPVYRRLAIILTCGASAVAIELVVIARFLNPGPGRSGQVHPGVFVALFLFGACSQLLRRARIRIDETGVARRRLLGWTVYPWCEFSQHEPRTLCAGERLSSGAGASLRPLYAAIQSLDAADCWQVCRLIVSEGTCTQLPETPREVSVWKFGGERLKLEERGLAFKNGEFRSWDDVKLVRIRKLSHEQVKLESVRIEFDDRSVHLIPSSVECAADCDCRRDDLLHRFLATALPRDRLLVLAGGGPQSIAEAWYRLDAGRRELRTMRILGGT